MASRGSRAKPTQGDEAFVGRRIELALISRHLEAALAGRGSFIAISGEPGIGKTRLAQASAALAAEKGFSAFWGLCHDGQYVPPYWPWKQLLRDLLKLRPGSRDAAWHRDIAGALSEILAEAGPDPARAAAMPRPMSERARLKMLESVTALLRAVSQSHPLVLIMDNLHCADVPSLQLLEVVAREMSSSRIVIIGSHRASSAEAGGALRATIGALAGQAFFEGIPLAGWELESVEECLKECGIPDPPPYLVEAVLLRTEGNPLFVFEVARLLVHEGLPDAGVPPSIQAWQTHIPQKVRLAILGHVQRLSPSCRGILAAGAIVGREFESSFLEEITREEHSAFEAILEEALAHALIEETSPPGRYRFTHALIEDVFVEQLSGPRRSALHMRVAEGLERRYAGDLGAHDGELARHFGAAGSPGAEKAVLYHRQAGERALRMHGYEDAFQQLSRALELGQGKDFPVDRARLLFALGQSQHGMGKFKEAVENHTRAFEIFVQRGEIDSAVSVLEQPMILTEKGARVTGLIERAISLVGTGSVRADLLGCKYGLAVYHDTGDYKKAARIFERALESARANKSRSQETAALTNWGRIEFDELHFERALALEKEALVAEESDIWLEAVARVSAVTALLGLGRLAEAEETARFLREFEERVHAWLWTSVVCGLRSPVSRQKGDLKSAREITERALALGEAPFNSWNRADRALAEYEQGNPERGAEMLEKVVREADRADMPFHWEGWLTLLIAYIAWVTGEPMPLEIAESSAQGTISAGGLRRGDSVTISAGLGFISVMRKDPKSAALHYSRLLPFSGLVVAPYLGLAADHILALLAFTRGDPARARSHFEAALAFCRTNGLKVEQAYTSRDFADFLLREGTRADERLALTLCEEASSLSERAGLARLAEGIAELRSRIGRGRPGREEHPGPLSEREIDVLRLLSSGLSNAKIGQKLFISRHTVANHVQHILEKTGAANRTEAAIYAVRHRLADQDVSAGGDS